MTSVQVVIPHGLDDTAERRRIREHIAGRYRRQHPAWDIVQAPCPTPEWSKGAAANPHLLSSSADVVVLADADSYTDPGQLAAAAEALAAGTHRWATPQTLVRRINQTDTARILSGEPVPRPALEKLQTKALPGGGIVAATPDTWRTVNGLDPRFVGWGGEDATLGMVLRVLCGPPWKPPAPTVLWHLWHPSDDRGRPSPANRDLWRRYRRARYTAGAVAEIVKEW